MTSRSPSWQVERIDGKAMDSPEARLAMDHCHAIRRTVFVIEQGVSESLEWDEWDAAAEHFLVSDTASPTPRPLGTARFRVVEGVGKAERVAVLREARAGGLGRMLMEAIEARARTLGLASIRLDAQVPVIPFYERLGYRAEGETFLEADIEHRAMTRVLAAAR